MFKARFSIIKRTLLLAAVLLCGMTQARAEELLLRGIISRPVIFFNDGTLLIGLHGDDSLGDINGNGLFEVLPGDQVVIGGVTNSVPELPGYPEGLPYEFDPTGPYIVGGMPQVVVNLDGTSTGEPAAFPGGNGITGDDDDIVFDIDDPDLALSEHGYLLVEGGGANVEHRDGSPLDGGAPAAGTVVASPNLIIRPGSGGTLPGASINPDGTIHLVPGNSIEWDGGELEPWVVTEPGTYDPASGLFYPDSDPGNPYPVPPESEGGEDGVAAEPMIEAIALDDDFIYLAWPGYLSSGAHLSRILAKVMLLDAQWELLQDGQRGVAIGETNAVIPRALGSIEGGSPGSYHFFKRVVP